MNHSSNVTAPSNPGALPATVRPDLIRRLRKRLQQQPLQNYVPNSVPLDAGFHRLAEPDDITFGDLREILACLETSRPSSVGAGAGGWQPIAFELSQRCGELLACLTDPVANGYDGATTRAAAWQTLAKFYAIAGLPAPPAGIAPAPEEKK